MSEGRILAGRYRLLRQVDAGGMGTVWRAADLTLKSDVAVKLIDESIANSPEAMARFEREACAAAAIRSTHVVQILDYGIDQGTPFIAMELLRGESLAARLGRVGRLSPASTAHILGHVARALSLAHEHGIVHRDLKPENIFLVPEGDEDLGKVLDFGIARHDMALDPNSCVKTQTGTLLGTPHYMSFEQATGQPADHRADIWAFGVIAFECLLGERPFDSQTFGGLFHAICMAPIPRPSDFGCVPAGFDGWFKRAVARERELRFPKLAEAATELRALCGMTGERESISEKPAESTQMVVARGAVPSLSVARGPARPKGVGARISAGANPTDPFELDEVETVPPLQLKETLHPHPVLKRPHYHYGPEPLAKSSSRSSTTTLLRAAVAIAVVFFGIMIWKVLSRHTSLPLGIVTGHPPATAPESPLPHIPPQTLASAATLTENPIPVEERLRDQLPKLTNQGQSPAKPKRPTAPTASSRGTEKPRKPFNAAGI